jgi:oligopeptide/dipeptide ABC transporter ATP-binding protein
VGLGRIVEEGPAGEVVRNPQHCCRSSRGAIRACADAHRFLRGETPDAVRIRSGCRFHPRCPIAVDVCRTEDPSLRRPHATKSPHHRAACLLA